MIDPNLNKKQLYKLIIADLISADNELLSEDEKQAIIQRYMKHPHDIHYIIEPIKDKNLADKYIDLLEELTKGTDGDPLELFEK